jgi:hypothetical protein
MAVRPGQRAHLGKAKPRLTPSPCPPKRLSGKGLAIKTSFEQGASNQRTGRSGLHADSERELSIVVPLNCQLCPSRYHR